MKYWSSRISALIILVSILTVTQLTLGRTAMVAANLQYSRTVFFSDNFESYSVGQATTNSPRTVFSADFETGDNSQFNDFLSNTCTNGTIGVSTSIVHSGHYAGYYHGQVPAGAPLCREYPNEDLTIPPYSAFQPLTDFYWSMWVYVPSVTLTNWISFATFGAGDGNPFTLDSNPDGTINLYVSLQPTESRVINQNLVSQPLQFPFDAWFHLELTAHGVGSSAADLTFSLNGTPIIHFNGLALSGPLEAAHFGLYMGAGQPSLTVYNDDILIQQLTQTLTTNVGSGSGSVTPNCSTGCVEGVGSPISVTATPSPGWALSGWTLTGASCSVGPLGNPCTFTMPDNAVTVSANFTSGPPTLTTEVASGDGSVSPNCHSGCQQQAGSSVSVSATAASSWEFSNWAVNGASCADGPANNPCTFTMPNNDVTLTATFTPIVITSTSTTSSSTVVSTTATTSSTGTTSSLSTPSTTSMFTTVSATSTSISTTFDTTTTTTGASAGASTTIFTSLMSTSYSTSSTTSSSAIITQTDVATIATHSSSTTTGTATLLSTTTNGGTVTISETDTFNVLLTNVFQVLDQFANEILQTFGFTVTPTPVGQQVVQVITTATTATTTTPSTVTMTVGYSVVGGGSPTTPVLHYVLGGVSKSLTLTKTPQPVSVDKGSAWSVTPNPLGSSSPSQRWYSNQPLTGRASVTTIVFAFQHEYFLTMKVNGPGSVTTSTDWYNAGQTVTIKATANAGHKFKSWTGTGTGSFTGTSPNHTITMNSAITEMAEFT